MSETLAGWAETITLAEGVEAVVAVRRGEFGELRFADGLREPIELSRIPVNAIAAQLRAGFGSGAARCFLTAPGEPAVAVDRERGEPLIALLQAAVAFSEGS